MSLLLDIGPYRVLSPIASGGFGKVFLARRSNVGGFTRLFAMKCLHDRHAGDGAAVAMLIDEARLASRITHTNVLSVIDVVDHDGALWLVMEYVEGESLATLVAATEARGERVPPQIACAVAAGVLHGLHAAHEATGPSGQPLGLVHRDVSPHNILVTSHGTPKLHDFGIAKAKGRVGLTEPGHIKGKLAYMSPEHLSGGDVDRRADIYSMGVVLWEALATRRLFPSAVPQDGLARGGGDALAAELDAPAAVRAVVAKCLATRAADRFATAAAAAAALESAAPLASEREVAAWVLSLAAGAIAERRAAAERTERDAGAPPGGVAPPAASDAPQLRTESAIEIGDGDAGPSLPAPPAPEPAPPPALPSRTPPARTLLLAAAAIAGAAIATSLWALRSEPRETTPERPAVTPAPSAALDPVSPPSADAVAPPASVAPGASTSAPPMSSTPPPRWEPERTTKPVPDPCDPPYVIDERGVKVIKTACVR